MSGGREGTLHAWWAATPELTALLPAAIVFTARVRDDDQDKPYAVLDVQATGTRFRSSSGRLEGADVTVRIYAGTDGYETARAIARALETAWGNFGAFDPGAGPRVWQMVYVDSGPTEDDDDTPHFAVQLEGVFAE